MFQLLIITIIASYLVSHLARRALVRLGVVDYPNKRKVHAAPVVRGGGVAIFLSFFLVFFLTMDFESGYTGFFVGAFLMFIVGIIDDVYEIKASRKLLGQVVAILIAMALGLKIEFINGPGATVSDIGWFSYPLTFLWLLGVTNAINLIDGLDGLAGGVGAISSIVLAIVAAGVGRTEVAGMALILAGSTIGFLPHNFSKKRKMFMGDSGSQFLGFSLAALSILGITKVAAVFTMLAPIMILGIPIFDTLFAIIRRRANGVPFYIADRGHLHHRLLDIGFSETKAVIFIYYISILLGLVAIYSTKVQPKRAVAIFLIAVLAIAALSYTLSKQHKARNGLTNTNKE